MHCCLADQVPVDWRCGSNGDYLFRVGLPSTVGGVVEMKFPIESHFFLPGLPVEHRWRIHKFSLVTQILAQQLLNKCNAETPSKFLRAVGVRFENGK
mmetsp:Transcript_11968/g.22998  ORF Transcript_11968/g.22998 Transcript_11968/m.22998 type:complete len:97 (+) Transcript_11968:46-336(+)